jgi:hypothetical protein
LEREIELRHHRPTNFELDVVPRRSRSVTRVQFDDLSVAAMEGVVSATVAEVDAADEGDVTIDGGWMAHEHHLLVMRTPSTNPPVAQDLAASLGDLASEPPILFRAEGEEITMGTPEETTNVDAPTTRVGEQRRDRRALVRHAFISVSAPIGEANLVAR